MVYRIGMDGSVGYRPGGYGGGGYGGGGTNLTDSRLGMQPLNTEALIAQYGGMQNTTALKGFAEVNATLAPLYGGAGGGGSAQNASIQGALAALPAGMQQEVGALVARNQMRKAQAGQQGGAAGSSGGGGGMDQQQLAMFAQVAMALMAQQKQGGQMDQMG